MATVLVITDPKADVDDIAALYQLLIDTNLDVTVVLGANKEVSFEESLQFMKLEELQAHALKMGHQTKDFKILSFTDLLSMESANYDYVLNISPWSVLTTDTISTELKQKALDGCPHITVNQMVVHQGTMFSEEGASGFNSIGNDAFFKRMQEEGKFIELNSRLCAGANGLMASKAYLDNMPGFVSELLLLNSFTQLVSRAPIGISSQKFSVLGLVDEAIGQGANYNNAKRFYEECIAKTAGNPSFDELPVSDSARQMAEGYVNSALEDMTAKGLDMHLLADDKKEVTITKLAKINAVIERAFGSDFFANGVITGLKPSPEYFALPENAHLEKAYQQFKTTPIVYTPLYDLQAWFMLNKVISMQNQGMSNAEVVKHVQAKMAKENPRAAMMSEIVDEHLLKLADDKTVLASHVVVADALSQNSAAQSPATFWNKDASSNKRAAASKSDEESKRAAVDDEAKMASLGN